MDLAFSSLLSWPLTLFLFFFFGGGGAAVGFRGLGHVVVRVQGVGAMGLWRVFGLQGFVAQGFHEVWGLVVAVQGGHQHPRTIIRQEVPISTSHNESRIAG